MRPTIHLLILCTAALSALIPETAASSTSPMHLRRGCIHACTTCGKFFTPDSLSTSSLPISCHDCVPFRLCGGLAEERPHAPYSEFTWACNTCGKIFGGECPTSVWGLEDFDSKYSGTAAFRGRGVGQYDQEAVSVVRAACGPELLVLPADADDRAYSIFFERFPGPLSSS